MQSAGPSVAAQGSYPTDYFYDDNDDREELVPPDLTRSIASSGVSSSTSANGVDVDGSMSGLDHDPCLAPMTPPHNPGDKHSPLSTISFRIGTSPLSLMKTTMTASDPGKPSIKRECEGSKRKSLLGGISSFSRSRSPAVEMKSRSWPPLSFPALSRSLGYRNPTHPAQPERGSVDLSTCIHVEEAPVPLPSHNAPTVIAAGAVPRTEPILSNPCIDGPNAEPSLTTGAINVARSGISFATSPNPAAAHPIMSNSPLPASNIPPNDLSPTYPPSDSTPFPKTPAREPPFSTSPQDPDHRLSWFSDTPLPRADICASPDVNIDTSPGLPCFHRKRPSGSQSVALSLAGKQYWFQCTHAGGLSSTTFASNAQRTTDDTGTGAEESSFTSSRFVALLQHSTILERVLRRLTWAEFSALANANHALRSFFEFGLVDSSLCTSARRERWRVRDLVLKRYLPGCDPSWSSGSPSLHRHREEECEAGEVGEVGVHTEDEIRVSMMDLDILSEYFRSMFGYRTPTL